ncbi:hypothetical protein M422DRAFT_265846 [Sphaerobolus stellatus SS14]|uniref:Unplaced genomic scaffold SPHSTscaffold_153, whole genome shotgun sequence n=1 Tax=Sphaerobolus stellatus (strain SS14) TaxID=990650 RepID=A0A0C9USX2_SPHS4|nr:hypothetical protein M422DRAFT_265846 [Sphaerobolus stellatus SS14]
MLSFLNIFSVSVLATATLAAPGLNAQVSSRCNNAKVVMTKTLPVGGIDLLYTSYSCDSANQVQARGLLDPLLCLLLGIDCPPPAPPPPPPSTGPVNVCGASCKWE